MSPQYWEAAKIPLDFFYPVTFTYALAILPSLQNFDVLIMGVSGPILGEVMAAFIVPNLMFIYSTPCDL